MRTNLSFTGLTGTPRFNSIGNRDSSSANYVLQNVVYAADTKSASFVPKAFFNATTNAWDAEPGTAITFNGNARAPPTDADRPEHNKNFYSSGFVAVSYLLFGINVALSLGFLIWTWAYRDSMIVHHSQPEFLAMICIGCVLSSSAVLAMLSAHDEGPDGSILNYERVEMNRSVFNPKGVMGSDAPKPFVVYTEGGTASADQACMWVQSWREHLV